ncbi:hypothetical protein B0O80DRAFT_447746 [Mortierella sp. GBAus27b]|nr:hypothetical protein B0O80DRAFT_447746 [Mortierella sp. GBAus27b]
MAIDTLNLIDDDGWYPFITRFGFVTYDALVQLSKMHHMVEFAENLQYMLDWLDEESNDVDGAFTRSLRGKLLEQPGIMNHMFTSSNSVGISARSVLYFGGERWIDDSAIDAILGDFQMRYGHKGTYFFVPTQAFEQWKIGFRRQTDPVIPWDQYKSTVLAMRTEGRQTGATRMDKEVKAFGVTNMDGHWGAFCVDFTKKIIFFGHSLDRGERPRPDDLGVVKQWLCRNGIRINSWTCERLHVAQQAPGSGSCGINAINAIERCLGSNIELWTGERSRFHRLRLLQLLIEGEPEVSSIVTC